MATKSSEKEFGITMRAYGIWAYKFRDMGQCPRCRFPLPKADKMVDFSIVLNGEATLVEVKQSRKNGRWDFRDNGSGVRPTQHEVLRQWEETQGVVTWIFLGIGNGRVNMGGREAYLIPYRAWLAVEFDLRMAGIKTLALETNRNIGSREVLAGWRLEWEGGGRWKIPFDHPFRQIAGLHPCLEAL